MRHNFKKKTKRIVFAWLLVASMIVPMFSYAMPAKAAETAVDADKNFADMSIEKIMKRKDSVTWVFTGDSITHNAGWAMGMNGYPEWFEQYLLDIPERQNDDVVNSAWGGADIWDIQDPEHTPADNGSNYDAGLGVENFITKYNPDVVFIKHGMNDRDMDCETYQEYYGYAIESIYKICAEKFGKRPKIILLSPSPVSSENPYDDEVNPVPEVGFLDATMLRRNDVEAVAKKYGLLFCDLRTAFLEESKILGDDYRHTFYSDSSDGTIHQNAAGQYFMFKTLCKTLGLYDETMPIFQVEYSDLNSAALFVDDTYNVNYDNNYGSKGSSVEMTKNMPDLTTLVASVDFDSSKTKGEFVGGKDYSKATRVNLTDASVVDDPLTLDEAKSMGKEFSVVFRAKLKNENKATQAVLCIGDSVNAEDNGLFVGVPGSDDTIYYYVGGSYQRVVMKDTNGTADDKWHTIAIVQEAEILKYYVDGELYYELPAVYDKGIGQMLSNASEDEFVAHIGSFSTKVAGSYNLQGTMDYYQLYKGSLTADEIKTLAEQSGQNGSDMDAKMPSIALKEVPSVLASVDFNDENGVFNGTNSYDTSTQVDLTDSAICNDVLTLEEAKGLKKEFSIVLRMRMEVPNNITSPILALTPDINGQWDDAVSVGLPGTANNLFYYVDAANNVTLPTTKGIINLEGENIAGDGKWHTIAFVQSENGLIYYVDGQAVYENATVKIINDIGGYFANATDVYAHIGSYAPGAAKTHHLRGKMDFYQMYGGALTQNQVQELTTASTETIANESWYDASEENFVWMLAGAEQMSGYEGTVVNRSLARLIDNCIRRGGMVGYGNQDIRTIDAAAPGYTMEKLNEEYDVIIGENDHDVFLLLPEVSQVYADDYQHSEDEVKSYKASVEALLAKEKDNVRMLWTPLASNDETINSYITEYAEVIREIAKKQGILMFDANKFMNDNMAKNESLKRNWFENDMYVTALCTTDLTHAFFNILCTEITYVSAGEVISHNLRYTTDKRIFKGNIVRDNIEPNSVTVNGEKVTINIEDIKKAYDLDSVTFAVMPTVGTGNYHEDIYYINDVTVSGDTYTFTAPCSNPVIAIYGLAANGLTYRFKDFRVTVTASKDLTNVAADPDGVYLDGLKVVGAPDLAFDKQTLTYDVNLYQYQRKVQILATAQEGLKITVNGVEVESGTNSQLINVEENSTVKVTVKDTVHTDKKDVTYTLHLSKPDYPDIIITEVLQDGYSGYTVAGADNYQLIEIYNASGKELNLLDYSIGFKTGYKYTKHAVEYEYPNYYFTGNNQAFVGRSGKQVSYTGINEITKYSSYWNDGSVTEPEKVDFPADSTMVIWVKFPPKGYTEQEAQTYSKALTYDTLIQTLKENKDKYVLSVDGEAVVPDMNQLVVAEVPKGVETGSLSGIATTTLQNSAKNFYMLHFSAVNDTGSTNMRGHLFVLKDTAEQDSNGMITEAGDDIVSATRFIRVKGMPNLSMVFSYNTERGMSLVKDEGFYMENKSGNTSDIQGYGNLTSFGAIEYWQKPADLGDDTKPTVTNNTPKTVVEGTEAAIDLTLKDNEDVRYMELYVRKAGETKFTKVSEDFVLKAGMENSGVSKDITSKAYTYALGKISGTVEYYGLVIDGNDNETTFGTEASPLTVAIGTGEEEDPTTPPTGGEEDPTIPPTGGEEDPTIPPTGGEENPTTPPSGDAGGTTTGGTTTGGTTTGGTTTGGTTTGGTTTGGTTTGGTTTENTTSLQTGDNSLIWLYVALILLTCVGVAVVVYEKKKDFTK